MRALQFWDKTGSGGGGGEGQNGSEKVGGQADPNEGKRGLGETLQKVTCNPAKSPLAVVSSHSHLARAAIKKCQVVPKFVPIC